MGILNMYLIPDIVNIILDYLYKPDIKLLNKEYHIKFTASGDHTGIHPDFLIKRI